MANPSVSSLFGDIISPAQVRSQQEAEDLARGQFLAQNRGSAGALYRPSNVRNVARSVSGMLGLETRSPEELKAEENQKLFSGLMQQAQQQFPQSRADQLDFVAKQLLAKGKTNEAMKAQDAAAQARMQEAELQTQKAETFQRTQAGVASGAQAGKFSAETVTEQQTRQGKVDKLAAEIASTNAQRMEREQSAKLTAEQLTTEIMKRMPSISKIEAETAAAKAMEAQRKSETETTNLMRPLLIEEKEAQITAANKGIEVDDARIKLINEQVDTEEVNRRAKEQQITVDQARKQLLDEELVRYQAMTPIEIIKANTEIAKNTQQARLQKAQLADIGMTDFLRELESTTLSEEEKEELKRKRAEGRAITAGVSGYDPNSAATAAVVDKIVRFAEEGEDASKGLAVAEHILKVAPQANTGALLNFKDAYTWVASNIFGAEGEVGRKIASELTEVLLNDALLEKTSILKGVLSDSDMKILKESIAQRGNNPQTIALAFTDFAAKRFAVVRSSEYFDRLLVEQGSNLKIPPFEIKKAFETLAELDYQGVAEVKGVVPKGTYSDVMDENKVDKALQLLEKFNIQYTPYYK